MSAPVQPDATVSEAPKPTTWTGQVRVFAEKRLPYDKLLPEKQPAYVASWIYVFGVGTLAALAVIVVSGAVLAYRGPAWYHISSVGLFFNSMHFWSVQLFFVFMVVHLFGKYFMAAWRGGRAKTWITGVLALMIGIMAAFTGYVLQYNFDSQWIAFEAKDGLNAVGIGAWFNVADVGQMLVMHAFLLPAVLGLFVVVHVVYVRIRGVVPPIDAAETDAEAVAALANLRGEA